MVGNHERDISASLEHYVEAVLALKRERGYARMTDVAAHLGVTKATASASMRTLAERGLVRFDAHRFLELSAEGERLATSLEGRNAVLKRFLTHVLGVGEKAADLDACRMEHGIGAETADRLVDLVRFLEDPKLRPVLERFRAFHRPCPAKGKCDPCEFACAGEDLIEVRPAPRKAKRASGARPKGRAPRAGRRS
jgi:DtxR family Mn-dependent transcriptional regulator